MTPERLAFVNCPFDASYQPCFEASIFACYSCGVKPTTSLSSNGLRPQRFDVLCDLIRQADFGIHDLSRTEIDHAGRPRFKKMRRGKRLPGPEFIASRFEEFQASIPRLAGRNGFLESDFNGLDAHIDFCMAVEEFVVTLDQSQRRAKRPS